MRLSNLETHVIDQFLFTLKKKETESLNPHRGRPVLYLKCWGSDYPYLQGLEQQKRWLPVPADSTPSLCLKDGVCSSGQGKGLFVL